MKYVGALQSPLLVSVSNVSDEIEHVVGPLPPLSSPAMLLDGELALCVL
jgi:hypothetical protein